MNIFEALEPRRLLAAGEIDPTFGTGGVARFAGVASGDILTNLLPTPDGKLLALGRSGAGHLEMVRFSGDGVIETSFGNDGTGLATAEDEPLDTNAAFAIDPSSGRIAALVTGESGVAVLVFTADGAPDQTFNGNGRLDQPADSSFTFSRIAFQPDGKLLLAGIGSMSDSGPNDVLVRRYRTDGTRDMSFGTGGRTPAGLDLDEPKDLVVLPDGRFALASDVNHFDSSMVLNWADDLTMFSAGGQLLWKQSVEDFTGFTIDYPGPPQATDLVFSPTDASLWVLTQEEHVALSHFAAADGHELGEGEAVFNENAEFIPTDLDVDGEGRLLFLTGSGVARDTVDGKFDAEYNGGVAPLPFASAGERALSHQGDRVVVASEDFHLTRLQGGAGTPASAALNGRGSLIVQGDGNPNGIDVYRRPRDGRIVVRIRADQFAQAGDGDLVVSFAPTRVKRIAIFAGLGDDDVTIAPGIPRGCYIDTGDGNNKVSGGDGADFMVGQGGDDTLLGNGGDDTILGGDGNDFLAGGAGADLIYGNDGRDTLRGNGGNDRLVGGEPLDAEPDNFLDGGDGFDRALRGEGDVLKDHIELVTDQPTSNG